MPLPVIGTTATNGSFWLCENAMPLRAAMKRRMRQRTLENEIDIGDLNRMLKMRPFFPFSIPLSENFMVGTSVA